MTECANLSVVRPTTESENTPIIIHVPRVSEKELTEMVHALSANEMEYILRLGSYALPLRSTALCIDQSSEDLKREFERQLQRKDQEKVLLVDMYRENTKSVIEDTVNERCEQYKQQLLFAAKDCDQYKKRIELVTQERDRVYDEMETKLQQERTRLRTEQESLFHALQEKNVVLQNQLVQAHREIEVRLKEESASFATTIKMMEQKMLETEKELVKMSESKNGVEKLMEMSVRDGIHRALSEHTQQEQLRVKSLEDELRTVKEKYEEKRTQEIHETLLEQKKQLEALTTELTVQKQQVDEIKHASSVTGRIGEATFHDLVQSTFCTYEGFDVTDTSKTPHSGDFELKFQDGNETVRILVDVKNFKKTLKISKVDVTKLFTDMGRNQSIRVAWMVALTGYISKYNTRQYVCDIVDGRLYVFINDLLAHPNPSKLLQEVWYMSSVICKQLESADSTNETVNNCRRYESRMKTYVAKLQKSSKKSLATLQQQTAILQQLREDLLDSDSILRDMMNDELSLVKNEHSTTVEEWWRECVVPTEGAKTKTNQLYQEFQKKTAASTISPEMFKTILKTMLNENELVVGKLEKSQYTVIGYTVVG